MVTIEKGICPKCNGYKNNIHKIGYDSSIHPKIVCSLCNGEGLIVIRTVEEIQKPIKESSPNASKHK